MLLKYKLNVPNPETSSGGVWERGLFNVQLSMYNVQ